MKTRIESRIRKTWKVVHSVSSDMFSKGRINTLLIMAILFQGSISLCAMDKEEFFRLLDQIGSQKYDEVEEFLSTNKDTLSTDPEYFVLLLNYAISKEGPKLTIGKGRPKPGELALSDPKTGEVVGFMGERVPFDSSLIEESAKRAQAAIPHFQNRLDIHFGILIAAEKIGRWDMVADQIVSMLKISKQNNNHWEWGPVNSMNGDPKEFMIQNILPYTSRMFRAETEAADTALQRCSEQLIQSYPELIYGYANMGVLNLAKKNYDKAREYFLKAKAIDPNDEIVKGNLELLQRLEANEKNSSSPAPNE